MASAMALKLNSKSTYLARKAIEYTYDWEVTGFTGSSNTLCSPDFIAGSNYQKQDCLWRLLFVTSDSYSYGLTLDARREIYFSSTTEMHGIVSIIAENGDEINQLENRVVFPQHKLTGLSFRNFPKIHHLLDRENGFLKNDTLTIRCRLYFFSDLSMGIYKTTEINLQETFNRLSILECHTIGSDNFEKLLESKAHSDVKLVVQDEEFHVHKCILAAHSRVFLAMFDHDMRESKENIVKITDVKAEVMKELLRFVYSTKVQNIETILDDLFAAADKYEIEALKVLCGQVYMKTLSIDNVGKLLELANTYNVSNLKTQALKFILNNQNSVDRESLKKGAESVSFSLLDFINALKESEKFYYRVYSWI